MKASRNTQAKVLIQNILKESEVALSHNDIQNHLDGACDRVTIYRVLDRLVNDGSIHKIINFDGVVKYASCTDCQAHHNHQHIHFSCEVCKSVTCLEGVIPSYNLPKDYVANEVNFTVSGICAQCKQ